MYQSVKKLINNKALRNDMSYKGYKVIQELWNSKVAAQRFLNLSNSIINGEVIVDYKEGPCSRIE